MTQPIGIFPKPSVTQEQEEDQYCLRHLPREHHGLFLQWREKGNPREDFEWCLMDQSEKVFSVISNPALWEKYKASKGEE